MTVCPDYKNFLNQLLQVTSGYAEWSLFLALQEQLPHWRGL